LRLLLDTHIWLWSLLEPERLTASVRAALGEPDNEIWLSPITLWETLILARKGRLEIDLPAAEWIDLALATAPVHEAQLTFRVALESQRIELPHRDPADRFLAASASVYDLTLVTADERLLGLDDIALLPNR
jgi:PIN domain nuclease of toxin-antitoxin system